jgi:uncharacterized caspase-like protein
MSLTEAVKLAATRNISLTDAVKDAGQEGAAADACSTRISEHAPVTQPAPSEPVLAQRGWRARRWGMSLLAGGARLGAIALLSVLFHLAGTTGIGSDGAPRAISQKRFALVVGNSAYQHTPKLQNPKHDATDIAAALRKLGFEVISGFDLDKAAFDRKIRDFAAALEGADAAVFFYAGHGLQVSGHNYLVPVDARLTSAAALDFEMVRLELVHRTMEREGRTNILFFDACRDNPLSRNLAEAMGTRSVEIGHGLAAVGGGVGTLISFSTQPGNVALDGKGRNSPFARALVRQLGASNDDLSAILIAVRNDVVKETARKQVPWEHSALTGRFYFNPAAQASAPAVGAQLVLSEAAEAWSATRDITNVAVLDAFVARFADTFFAELARARIADLKKQDAPNW